MSNSWGSKMWFNRMLPGGACFTADQTPKATWIEVLGKHGVNLKTHCKAAKLSKHNYKPPRKCQQNIAQTTIRSPRLTRKYWHTHPPTLANIGIINMNVLYVVQIMQYGVSALWSSQHPIFPGPSRAFQLTGRKSETIWTSQGQNLKPWTSYTAILIHHVVGCSWCTAMSFY